MFAVLKCMFLSIHLSIEKKEFTTKGNPVFNVDPLYTFPLPPPLLLLFLKVFYMYRRKDTIKRKFFVPMHIFYYIWT